jgi:hypothetical protein
VIHGKIRWVRPIVEMDIFWQNRINGTIRRSEVLWNLGVSCWN